MDGRESVIGSNDEGGRIVDSGFPGGIDDASDQRVRLLEGGFGKSARRAVFMFDFVGATR